ncbi:25852_t:CDS:2, partial [Racocetra persica]
VRTAATRIRKLTQGSKSASSYASEFRQISSDLDWGEAALIDQFRIGLKNDVKDLLLTMEDPTSLNDAIAKAVRCDNRLFERRRERQGHSLDRGDSVSNYSRSSLTPEPMQIDSTRARTLSEEEKQRRWANNFCLYCGEPGHIAKKLGKRGAPTAVRVFIQLSNKSMLPVNALIDSGASACFLDYTLAHKYNLPINTKRTPLSVEVIDGREISSGAVIHETGPLLLCYQNHYEEIIFNLIQTPHYQVILGLPWLIHHNPNINWREHTLKFPDADCNLHLQYPLTKQPTTHISTSERVFLAQAFHVASVRGDSVTATLTLPTKYNDFSDVFDEKEANRLPEHRPYDCAIDLVPGKQPPWGPIYGLSELELETLK